MTRFSPPALFSQHKAANFGEPSTMTPGDYFGDAVSRYATEEMQQRVISRPQFYGLLTLQDDAVGYRNSSPNGTDMFCKKILYWELPDSRVRVWDLAILLPNVVFLLVLACQLERAKNKLRASCSAIYFTFYVLVVTNLVVSVVRCAVSMTVNAALPAGSLTDKMLWVVVRFFLLSTELSVVIFGLAFGHLDSRTSIRQVLIFTSLISFSYSCGQAALEITSPDEIFYIPHKDYNIFAHGGKLFWLTNSVVFALLYAFILILPWTPLRERVALPAKKGFYYYILFLALLYTVQAVGIGLLFIRQLSGLCIVDLTTYIYFTLFTPLIYHTFLSDVFSVTQSGILFSYKNQVDEALEEDNVSLPHQLSCSSLKTDSDYVYQSNMYESTQFEASGTPVNPLYAYSHQSPDSVHVFDAIPGPNNIGNDTSSGINPGEYQRLVHLSKPVQQTEQN